MPTRNKSIQISLLADSGTFTTLFKRFSGSKKSYDFEGLAALRHVLSNQKARLLSTVKHKSPKSIYELAKFLERDFKSVNDDVKLLKRFGFIDLISEKSGNRKRLKPVIASDMISIELKL